MTTKNQLLSSTANLLVGLKDQLTTAIETAKTGDFAPLDALSTTIEHHVSGIHEACAAEAEMPEEEAPNPEPEEPATETAQEATQNEPDATLAGTVG